MRRRQSGGMTRLPWLTGWPVLGGSAAYPVAWRPLKSSTCVKPKLGVSLYTNLCSPPTLPAPLVPCPASRPPAPFAQFWPPLPFPISLPSVLLCPPLSTPPPHFGISSSLLLPLLCPGHDCPKSGCCCCCICTCTFQIPSFLFKPNMSVLRTTRLNVAKDLTRSASLPDTPTLHPTYDCSLLS